MDEPKYVAERYDWKYMLIIAELKVTLEYILYLYTYIITETQWGCLIWKLKGKAIF
jgi:hypothetical protein